MTIMSPLEPTMNEGGDDTPRPPPVAMGRGTALEPPTRRGIALLREAASSPGERRGPETLLKSFIISM